MPERENQDNNQFDQDKSPDTNKDQRVGPQNYDILEEVGKIVEEKSRQDFIDQMNA